MADLTFSLRRAAQHATAVGTGRRSVVPAPTLGLNALDAEADMNPAYALEMLNALPEHGHVRSRRGSKLYADTGDTGGIGTLAVHRSGGVERAYAFSPTKLWDITDPDSPAEVSGVTVSSSRWRTASIGTSLVAVNGTDNPIRIVSGAVNAHGYTGIAAPKNLTSVAVHHNRLWFTENDSPKLWYGALNAVTGALKSIDLGLVVSGGGPLRALGSVTLDSGSGVDDLLAVFFDSGQVALYAGTNPEDAANWRIAGVFDIGRVVGADPLVKRGGDLIAVTVDGFIPLLPFLHSGRSQPGIAVSDKISPLVREAVRESGSRPGWQAVMHAPGNWLLFNVPIDDGVAHQFVANLSTGAWGHFTGMNAECWSARGDRLLYGASGGRVIQADVGNTDVDGTPPIRIRSAFNYLGTPYDKHFKTIRAHVESDGGRGRVNVGATVNFDRDVPILTSARLEPSGALWDTAKWDTFKWGAGLSRTHRWQGLMLKGNCISVHLTSQVGGYPVSLFSTDVLYDQTAGIVDDS